MTASEIIQFIAVLQAEREFIAHTTVGNGAEIGAITLQIKTLRNLLP